MSSFSIKNSAADTSVVVMSRADFDAAIQQAVREGAVEGAKIAIAQLGLSEKNVELVKFSEVRRRLGTEKPYGGTVQKRPLSYHSALAFLKVNGIFPDQNGYYNWADIKTKIR